MEAEQIDNESEEMDITGTDDTNEASSSDEEDMNSEGGNIPAPETGVVFFSIHSPRHTGLRPHFLGPRRRS